MTGAPVERKKVLLLSGTANTAFVVLTGVVGFVSLPLGLQYFGPVQYGIWLVITSLVSYLGLLNCGIPTATTTLVAQAQDESRQRAVVHRALRLTLALSVGSLLILAGTLLLPEWSRILGQVPPGLEQQASSALLVFTALTLLQMPSLVFPAAFAGLQQVYWERAYAFLRSLALLGALLITIRLQGSLVTMAVFSGVATALVGLASGLHLLLLRPAMGQRRLPSDPVGAASATLVASGIRFLALQIAVLVIWNSDNLIISHILGPAQVTPYAMTFKLFQACFLLMTASVVSLWPMYAQASGQQDWNWIQRTYDSSTAFQILLGGLIWVGGILFAGPLLEYFAPGAYAGTLVAFALGGYVYVSSFFGANAGLINGLNPTTAVVAMGMLEAGLNLGLSLLLIRPLGIGGVALGTLLASLAINSWLPPLYIRRRTQNRISLDVKPVLKHSAAVAMFVALALLVGENLAGISRLIAGLAVITTYIVVACAFTLTGAANALANLLPAIRLWRR